MIFDVWLHSQRVGQLRRLDEAGSVFSFFLTDDYGENTARPVLGQIFEGDESSFNGDVWRLPAWFHELLPEGPLRKRISQDAGLKSSSDVSLLQVVGGDLPGAVVITGDGVPPDTLSVPTETGDRRYRWSLAGVQLKLSVLRLEDKVVMPVSGNGGRFLLKLPSAQFVGLPRHEHGMLQWARQSGICVPDHELVSPEAVDDAARAAFPVDEDALLIRRFDRGADGERIHFEDFAQIRNCYADDDAGGPDGDARYSMLNTETLLNYIHVLCPNDVREAFRRIVFMILSGNGDAHVKNWALLYADRRTPRLSPAYDLVSTVAFGQDHRLALRLNGSSSFGVSPTDLGDVMAWLEYPRDETMLWLEQDVTTIVAAWREAAAAFTEDHRRVLTSWLSSHPLTRPFAAVTRGL